MLSEAARGSAFASRKMRNHYRGDRRDADGCRNTAFGVDPALTIRRYAEDSPMPSHFERAKLPDSYKSPNDFSAISRKHRTIRTEHLQAVPRGRIVAGGNLNRTGGSELPHREAASRRQGDADIFHGAARAPD